MPLVTLDHISHAFGHLPLLDDVSLQIQPGERLALNLLGRLSGIATLTRSYVDPVAGAGAGDLAQGAATRLPRAVWGRT